MAFAFGAFSSTVCFGQFTQLWNQTTLPNGNNMANGISVNYEAAYVAGCDLNSGNEQLRLERRYLNTGALNTFFGVNGVITVNPTPNDDVYNGIIADGNGIYLTGTQDMCLGCDCEWRIEKRNRVTGAPIWTQISDPSLYPDGSNAITIDSNWVYVAGTVGISFLNWAWRVEKRQSWDGVLVWGQTIDITAAGDTPLGIAVDASGVYVVGAVFDAAEGVGDKWRIEKRDIMTGAIIWEKSGIGERAQGIAIDNSGIYIVGDSVLSSDNYAWHIEKRDLTTGSLIPSFGTAGIISNDISTGHDDARAVTTHLDYMYITGRQDGNLGDSRWYLEKRNATTGALICSEISNPSNERDDAKSIAKDASGIYIAGTDLTNLIDEWRIEKYDFCGISSTPDIESGFGISIYPNPFSSATTLQSENLLRDATLTVYNASGQKIKQIENISGHTVVFSRENLPGGLYLFQLTQDNQLITTNKLIIND